MTRVERISSELDCGLIRNHDNLSDALMDLWEIVWEAQRICEAHEAASVNADDIDFIESVNRDNDRFLQRYFREDIGSGVSDD